MQPGRTFFATDNPFEPQLSTDNGDLIGHGTICARLILTVAPEATIIPLRIFDRTLETSPAVLCAALQWAKAQNFDVLSLSLCTDREDARDPLYVLCEEFLRAGTITVAAARNGVGDGYPAAFESVIGVTVGDPGAGQGGGLRAPGDMMDVVVEKGWLGPPLIAGEHPPLRSTSHATAFIAGCVSRLLTAEGRLSLGQVRERLAHLLPQIDC